MVPTMEQKTTLLLDLQLITRIHGKSQTFHPVTIDFVIVCHDLKLILLPRQKQSLRGVLRK